MGEGLSPPMSMRSLVMVGTIVTNLRIGARAALPITGVLLILAVAVIRFARL